MYAVFFFPRYFTESETQAGLKSPAKLDTFAPGRCPLSTRKPPVPAQWKIAIVKRVGQPQLARLDYDDSQKVNDSLGEQLI
jgi:hypothetical protein